MADIKDIIVDVLEEHIGSETLLSLATGYFRKQGFLVKRVVGGVNIHNTASRLYTISFLTRREFFKYALEHAAAEIWKELVPPMEGAA